ncbi:MAG: general secretion pathway protein GspK [Alphaproteobacteria bacterium]|nr:general secretion pathway protein GspK [Alphaproteobacteria bacterium]
MSAIRRLWRELVRPRGHQRHRFYRVGRGSRAGVALLMVITSIMMLTILVTEISHGAAVRTQLARHHRDEVKAEMLATSGVQIYRLVLMASKMLGSNPMISQFSQMMGINGDSLWQMIPFINTQMMRMILVTGGDVEDIGAGGLTDEQVAKSRERSSAFDKNFLDFDGDFQARVDDENRFIFVGNFSARDLENLQQSAVTQQLMGLMTRENYDQYLYDNNLEKMELIANLVDWTDPDDTRLWEGGREDALYERLDSPYRSKNAPFDTLDEIRLVDGWHLDGVWERMGRHLTIYGGGKVNVNTAHRPVIFALIQGYTDVQYPDQVISDWVDVFMQYRGLPMAEGGLYVRNGQQFYQFMTEQVGVPLREEVQNVVTGESTTFRITSSGEVGDARVEITAVIDYSRNATGDILYWKVK